MNEPQIIDKPEMTFVGFEGLFRHALSPDADNFKIIPPLWDKFIKAEAIPGRIENGCSWGVIYADPPDERSHPDELHYIAAATVSSATELPDGIAWHLPASKFACFRLRGPISRIGEHCRYIYREWLPTSPWEHSIFADIERYDEKFCADSEESEMEYWISIKPKSDAQD